MQSMTPMDTVTVQMSFMAESLWKLGKASRHAASSVKLLRMVTNEWVDRELLSKMSHTQIAHYTFLRNGDIPILEAMEEAKRYR